MVSPERLQRLSAARQDTSRDSKAAPPEADSDTGWHAVTRQGKKQAQLAAAAAAAAKAAALRQDPQLAQPVDSGLGAPETPLMTPGEKFRHCTVKITLLPSSWSHTQIQQACLQYGSQYGYVVLTWSGLSNRGLPFGMVRFSEQSSARKMLAEHNRPLPAWCL